MKELSQAAVRAVMIAAQGLHQQEQPSATKQTVLDTIRQMHVLQIDTISVVARSPYFVLWSRLGDYDPRWLEALLEERHLFEYWSHAACFLPMEDFPLFRRWMTQLAEQYFNAPDRWLSQNQAYAANFLAHIREKGAVRSADFKRSDGEKAGWWNWKEEKIALESLFNVGELMVVKRHNFQRIYDLRERIVPDWDDAKMPALDTVYDQWVENSVQALGVTKAEWIADYFRISKASANAALQRVEKQGRVKTIQVEGWDAPGYYHPKNEALIQSAADGVLPVSKTTLLSPFDPLVWDRVRALSLFNFDYKIECYTPAPKRKYGYFTLPILYNNQLIGRLDPKAHRKEGIFEVKALHLEPGVVVDDAMIAALKATFQACANWHKTPEVVVKYANQDGLVERLSK